MGFINPDPILKSGFGSRRPKMKIGKKLKISFFEVRDILFRGQKASPVAWMSFKEA
jgi:hypothetical protein